MLTFVPHEELWNNIDVEIGPGILPELNSVQPEASTSISESLLYSHETCRNQINEAIQFARNKHNYPSSTFLESTQYLMARLVMDTLTRKESIFHHRRSDSFQQRLALLPASTHLGDIIWSFVGSEIPYVLRPHEPPPGTSTRAFHWAFASPKSGSESSRRNTAHDCRQCQSYKVSLYRPRFNDFINLEGQKRRNVTERNPVTDVKEFGRVSMVSL